METLKEIWAYFWGNLWGIIFCAYWLSGLIEAISKLTPTKKDDTFSDHFKKHLDWITSWIPNVKKQPGKWIIPSGVHEPREKDQE